MTNAELLAKIKAEIERQIKNVVKCATNDNDRGVQNFCNGQECAYDDILSFLSTLESEKPMNQDEFNTELKRVTADKVYEYYPEQDGDFITEIDFTNCIRDVAHHFAEWGAEHLKK